MAAFSPLLDLLADVPDPRRAEGKLYKPPHVLLFSILAIVSGSNSYRGVVTFIDVHRTRLNAAFGLTWRRAPAHTASCDILQGLDPAAVEAVFRRHAAQRHAACTSSGQGSVALDGKTLRGSVDRFYDRPGAGLHRHAGRAALPKKLFDRTATAKLRLIVQLKDNQRTLLQQCRSITAVDRPLTVDHSQTTGRNRDERRTVSIVDMADKLAGTPWQPAIAAVIQIEREVFTRDAATGLLQKTTESVLYLSNAPLTAETVAAAIQAHWVIDNTSHYTPDMTMGEDRSRIRTNPGMLARRRSFGFNISKADRSGTLSQDRYRAALASVKRMLKFKGVT